MPRFKTHGYNYSCKKFPDDLSRNRPTSVITGDERTDDSRTISTAI